MKRRLTGSLVTAAAVAAVLAMSPIPAAGQEEPGLNGARGSAGGRQIGPTGPAPRAPNGKPDLSGVRSPDRTFIYNITSALKKGETLPIQPWAEKLTKERMSKDDPEARCLPTGVPRMTPYPWRIIQTPIPPGTASPSGNGREMHWS